MGVGAAPLWLIFATQLASVAGDALGQRCSRVYHNRSRRRFVLSMVVVTAVQMTVALCIIQLAFPGTATQLTKSVNGTKVDVCSLPEGDPDRGSSDECYAQGPITLYRAVAGCPLLLLDGVINVLYYIGEASMYRESLGVILIVMAALSSTFMVAPLQEVFHVGDPKQAAPAAIALGVIGAILCTVERSVTVRVNDDRDDEEEEAGRIDDLISAHGEDGVVSYGTTASSLIAAEPSHHAGICRSKGAQEVAHLQEELLDPKSAPDGEAVNPHHTVYADSEHEGEAIHALSPEPDDSTPMTSCKDRAAMVWGVVKQYLPLLVPFFGLAFVAALYMVLILYYDNECSINPLGFNAFDQGTLPLYIIPAFALMDFIPALRLEHEDDARDQRIHTAFARAVREDATAGGAGFMHMFVYRLLLNGRAIANTFIAVEYDLAQSYLELTLVRVLLSWVVSFSVVIAAPKFIRAREEERAKVKDKVNLVAKVLGSLAVVGSLLIMKYA